MTTVTHLLSIRTGLGNSIYYLYRQFDVAHYFSYYYTVLYKKINSPHENLFIITKTFCLYWTQPGATTARKLWCQ